MAAGDIMLYWGSGSPPCWRVMLVLEEKGLSGYQNKMISFSDKGHKSEEILKLNPRGQVPTMRIGDIIVNESMAAIDVLNALYKDQGTALYPSSAAALALVHQRKNEALNVQKKGSEDLVYMLWTTKPENIDQEKLKEKKQNLRDELNIWEGYLNQNYIAGPDFSMADVVFFPQLAFLIRVGLQLGERFPRLGAYYTRLCQRESVKKTWPPHWSTSDNPTLLADV